MKRITLFFVAALGASTLGCGASGAAQTGPGDTLRAYAHALEQGRIEDAYALLSAEAKRTMSLEAFRRAVQENPEDAMEIARAISRPTGDPVVTATVTVPNGEELLLLYEDGTWRIDAAAVDLYGQATPRQALIGFLRAFERKRYDVVLRYVPDVEKEGLAPTGGGAADGDADAAPPPEGEASPEGASGESTRLTAEKLRATWEGPQKDQMNRIVQAIRAALPNATIEETGDQASMSYGAGGTVAFLREHGVWKIKDF